MIAVCFGLDWLDNGLFCGFYVFCGIDIRRGLVLLCEFTSSGFAVYVLSGFVVLGLFCIVYGWLALGLGFGLLCLVFGYVWLLIVYLWHLDFVCLVMLLCSLVFCCLCSSLVCEVWWFGIVVW